MGFIKRNKYLLVGVVMLILVASASLLKKAAPSCEQPQNLLVDTVQYICSENIGSDPMRLNAYLCNKIKGEDFGCEFTDEDKAAAESIIKDLINKCVDKTFVENKICIDKYKKM